MELLKNQLPQSFIPEDISANDNHMKNENSISLDTKERDSNIPESKPSLK